jgi:16S rRNA (guanine(966)-N(2))-methyltransferase RsmD
VLRVIAGTLKGRQLRTPTWKGLRPTSDRLRETLFNVLAARVGGARVMDGFAGTGALGIEALSRGAAHVDFVENDPRAQALIESNLARCGIEKGCAIIRASVADAFRTFASDGRTDGAAFDLILLDPPYGVPPETALTGAGAAVAPGGMLVLEHDRRQRVPERAGRLVLGRDLASGNSALAFYTCQP